MQQVVQADGKVISKRRIIAVYPYGLKFVTEPPEDQFEPEHIADLFAVRYQLFPTNYAFC